MSHTKTKNRLLILALATILAIGVVPTDVFAFEADNEKIGNGLSLKGAISGNGRYIAFSSDATDLVAGDTNGQYDVFVKDRNTNTVTRVSEGGTSGSPIQGDSTSFSPSISFDGRYVAFVSEATNLVASDTNSSYDVFVMDRDNHTLTRVEGGTVASPVEGDSHTDRAVISANGRYIAFSSYATNLIADAGGSGGFVMDRNTHTLKRVGTYASDLAISDNGRYVTFTSTSSSLVPGDTNSARDVFVMDLDTDAITRVSEGGTSESPIQADGGGGFFSSNYPSISADGRYVAFQAWSGNMVPGDGDGGDVFVMDRNTHTLTRVSEGGTVGSPVHSDDYVSNHPSISADGRFVTFESYSTGVVQDVYIMDRNTHTLTRVSAGGTAGSPINADYNSDDPTVSADGHYVLYNSAATNVVAGDVDGLVDLYLYTNPSYTDIDGVDNSLEIAAPNQGDANNDGVGDILQQTVTSLVSPTNSQYVVLESNNCATNSTVSLASETSNAQQDGNYSYPAGLLNFTLTGCTVGSTETITQYYYGTFNLADVVLRKYNSTTNQYATITGAVLSAVTIGGQSAIKAVYQVTDGGILDEDGVANGTIIDPAGIAVLGVSSPNTGFEQNSIAVPIGLIIAAGALVVVARLYVKSNARKK